MDWLVNEMGGKVYLANKAAPKNHRSMWRWTITGRNCGPILFNLLPYLRLKEKQAEFALRFISTMSKPGENKRLTPEVLDERNHIVTHMKRMNQRGRSR